MAKTIKVGKYAIPLPIITLFLIGTVLGLTIYAEMYGYIYVTPKPVAVWLTPSTYYLSVYTMTFYHQLATIKNQYANMTFEIGTEIWGSYYDINWTEHDIAPYVHVMYLDYETRTLLPDSDGDGLPEIFAPVGETQFYVQIFIDEIPNLEYGWCTIHTMLTEFVESPP